ncbi:MraY family glycosyltransferase [Agrococcus versicolor]|uniref:MraY family glycosyltransferase n=1 Tax=Agrococcus versicolor TaxID=501482 RepID=A0ABN3AT98_9MICO
MSLGTLRFALAHGIHPPVRERDVHATPTPRLGGVAMFAGVLAAVIAGSFVPQFQAAYDMPLKIVALLGATGFIVVVGVLDDLLDLDWMVKLGAQLVAAGVIAFFVVRITSTPNPFGGIAVGSSQMSVVLTVITIVLVMNAVNFIDGLDALVAGTTIIGSAAFFVYIAFMTRSLGQLDTYFSLASILTAIVVGACVGFLPLNWHPAKMFMGDAGALMIGLLTATAAISVTGQIDLTVVGGRSQLLPAFIPVLLPFAILALPLLDFVLAVVRRLLNGQSPFAADRKHLHHRLLDMGHTHLGAVLIFYSWTIVVSVGCLLFLVLDEWVAAGIIGIGFLVCAILTALPVSRRVWHSARRLAGLRAAERRARRSAPELTDAEERR